MSNIDEEEVNKDIEFIKELIEKDKIDIKGISYGKQYRILRTIKNILTEREQKDKRIKQLEEGDSMEEKCCNKCGSDYEEEYYKYNNKIYCFNCLIDELESSGQMIVVRTTHYYNDDWGQLGTDDDIDETVKNICEEFDVEEVKQ